MLTLGLQLGSAKRTAQASITFIPAAMAPDVSKSLDVQYQDTYISGMSINNDGSLVIISGLYNDKVFRFDGASHGNLSTAIYNPAVTDTFTNQPTGLIYNPTGTIMSIFHWGTAIEVHSCTAYTPMTNTYIGQLSLSGTGIIFGRGMAFNQDGTKLVVVGQGSRKIHYYDLATAYNPSTGTRNVYKELDFEPVIGSSGNMSCIQWLDGDNVLQVSDLTTQKIYHIDLTITGDPSTGINNPSKALETSGVDNEVHAFKWSPDGRYLYLAGRQHNKVHVLSVF